MHSCANESATAEPAEPSPTPAPDRKTLDKLLRANERLIRYIVYRYRNRGVETDDLMQIARIAFCQAVGKHDPARGSLACYAGYVMQSALARAIQCERRRTCLSLDALVEGEGGGVCCLYDLLFNPCDTPDPVAAEIRRAVDRAMRLLPLRLQTVMRLRYGQGGATHAEVSIEVHRTTEACRQAEARALALLRRALLLFRPTHPPRHHNR